jgi:hypothetical protein
MYLINHFSKIVEFIILGHLHIVSKHKLNFSQHGFREYCSTSTTLVTYVITHMLSVSTRGHFLSVYFYLNSAFDIVFQSALLCKLTSCGLSSSYVNWLHSYLTYREALVLFSGTSTTTTITTTTAAAAPATP